MLTLALLASMAPDAFAVGSLTGYWVGLDPDGVVFAPGAGYCDFDITLNLTQAGSAVSGTAVKGSNRVVNSCLNQNFSSTEQSTGLALPVPVTGSVVSGTVSLTIIAARYNFGVGNQFTAIVVSGAFPSGNNLALTGQLAPARIWTDSNLNGVPDCALLNPSPNGECGAVTGPIKDITLTAPLGGAISGVISNAAGGALLQNVSVRVFNGSGVSMGSATTNASGVYTTPGVPVGTYYLRTSNTLGFIDELWNDKPCPNGGCSVTNGDAIAVTTGVTTTGKDFALAAGGLISGTVTNAVGGAPLQNVSVQIFDAGGVGQGSQLTDAAGNYITAGLPPGTYYARTAVTAGQYFLDELYNEKGCTPTCTVTTGDAIVVTTGATQSGKNFTLTPGGGSIAGTVKDTGTLVGLGSASVQLYSSGGSFISSVLTNSTGAYAFGGVPAGAYYARTSVGGSSLNYVDELYNEKPWPCIPACLVTTGDPITVVDSATAASINFTLSPSLVNNGTFGAGLTGWQTFATPDLTHMAAGVSSGVLQFSRDSTSSQATVFQETGIAFASGAPILATFDLGNTSTVRKYMKVLVIESDFSDFAACTFWLGPSAPLRTYRVKLHTTKAWTNAAIYFYASTKNVAVPLDSGVYQVDNVSVQSAPGQAVAHVDCIDPTAPTPPGGGTGPNLLTNGDFETNALSPWTTFGTITAQAPAGVLQMIRPTSTPPSGVVLQPTNQGMPSGQLLTASFQLGNSSGVRKRVTVLMHDLDFSDLVACVFWLAPSQALSNYSIIGWASKAWSNATLSFYAATIGPDQWTLIDNAVFQTTPTATTTGATCNEPGAPSDVGRAPRLTVSPAGRAILAQTTIAPDIPPRPVDGTRWVSDGGFASVANGAEWEARADRSGIQTLEGFDAIDLQRATTARLTFASRLSTTASEGAVQVRVSGSAWELVGVVPSSDSWLPLEIDLTPYIGGVIEIRFVFDVRGPIDRAGPDVWGLDDLRVDIDPLP